MTLGRDRFTVRIPLPWPLPDIDINKRAQLASWTPMDLRERLFQIRILP